LAGSVKPKTWGHRWCGAATQWGPRSVWGEFLRFLENRLIVTLSTMFSVQPFRSYSLTVVGSDTKFEVVLFYFHNP